MLIKNFGELAKTPERKIVLEIIEEGLQAIQPQNIIHQSISFAGNVLKIKDQNIDLTDIENIYLLGFGKGSAHIAKLIEEILGERLTEGFVIDTNPVDFAKIQGTVGSHPLPSQTNLDFTKKVVDRFENNLTKEDLVLVVVCGGGSVLFELPASLTLDGLRKKNDELLKSGLTIEEMNKERKKMSRVKGGGLAKILSPAKVVGLVFSDVPGNDIGTIASGPTDDPSALNVLMLSNQTALSAMKGKAEELGKSCFVFSDHLQEEAEKAGATILENTPANTILIAGGETTVEVKGQGKGGRNQTVVLSVLKELDEQTVIASVASDGWDNTPFAGAIGDKETVTKAQNLGISIEEYLGNNDSFNFFEKVGDGIITGRLPSNISDLFVFYRY